MNHQKGLLAIAAAAVLWSTGGLLIKLIDLPPLAITAYRSGFAMLVFAVIFQKNVLKINRRMWLNSFFYAAMLLCFVAATKFTTAANAIFLQFTAPIYILLLEPVLFKIRLRRADVLTVVACVVGMSFFMINGFGGGQFGGNLLAMTSGVAFAGFVLGQRLNAPETHSAAIFWGNLLVVVVSLPVVVAAGWTDFRTFSMLSFLGIVQIGCAYALFTYGLKRTLAIEASLLGFIEPILNPIWVWLGYGERPSNWAILGGAIILGSLVVRTILMEKKEMSSLEH